MKKNCLLTALLLMCQFTFAQYENFDLSTYKLPDIKRHQLDFNFSFNNSIQSYSFEESQDHSFFDLDNNLDVTYSYYRNTPKVQSEGWGSFSYSVNLDRSKSEDQNALRDDQFRCAVKGGFNQRSYFNDDNRWFWSLSPVLNVSSSLYRNKELWDYDSDLIEKYNTNYLNVNPKINFGGGFGRVEQVGDARKAIYIIEDLYKKNKLSRLPDEEELVVIANRVAQLRNQRFFDSRLRHIYEMESLDSLLNTMSLVSDGDVGYFTSLNDMWLYGYEPRYSGTRFEAELLGVLDYSLSRTETETYDFSYEKITSENEINRYDEIVGFTFSMDSYKPIGLRWQRNFSIHILGERYFSDSDVENISNDFNYFLGSIDYRYKWFYNTRTYASFGLGGNYYRYDYLESEFSKDRNNFSASISGSLNYYFSPRLKASVRINAYNNWYQNDDASYYKTFSFGSQASLNYAIF